MSMHRRHQLLALAAACALAACSTTGEKAAPPMSSPAPASQGTSTASSATVNLASASGSLVRGKLSMRSEEHTSELQSLMRNSYAVFCLKKNTNKQYLTQH